MFGITTSMIEEEETFSQGAVGILGTPEYNPNLLFDFSKVVPNMVESFAFSHPSG